MVRKQQFNNDYHINDYFENWEIWGNNEIQCILHTQNEGKSQKMFIIHICINTCDV